MFGRRRPSPPPAQDRLDAVVARAAQLLLRPEAAEEVASVEGELNRAIDELHALGAGLAAVDALSGMT